MQVLETIAAAHPDIQAEIYGAVLLCALCLARGDTVAGIARALGMSEQDGFDISKAEILNVAQLTWSSPAIHPKMDSAAKLTNWELVIRKLPQGLRLRLLLVLIAVYKDMDHGANEAHMLCMTEAPAAREDVSALWAWLRTHLAVGLLERWAAENGAQAAGHADALLEGMQFFSLPAHLMSTGRPKAVIGVLLRFFDVAVLIGEPFFRSKLLDMASLLTEASQDSSSDVLGPIWEALHAAVRNGVAAAGGSHPEPVPAPASLGRREQTAPKRGSTVSPGAEALAFAARWLALLSCAMAQRPLPTHALELMSDLVQLLYYHGPPAPDAPQGNNDRGRSGSPLVQECTDAIRGAIGVAGAQQLWVTLFKQHSTDPVNLQWLPLLACWLSADGSEPTLPQKGPAEARHVSPAAMQSRNTSPKKLSASPTQHDASQEVEGRKGASPVPAGGSQHGRADAEGGMSLDRNAEEALQLQSQLEPITPCADISAHLAQLAHLYEASCPVLSNIYMLLAPLSPESLPGGNPNFIAGSSEALHALMQLHPLKLGKPQKVHPKEVVAGPAFPAASISSMRKAAVSPAAYADTLKHQDQLASHLASSAELLRSWSHRREKRQAAATPPRQITALVASTTDDSDSDAEAEPGSSADPQDLPVLKSPRMSQGSVDGDVPEVISQAQARLWEGLTGMAEHLDNLNAIVRELVVRRYRPIDIKRVEAGEYGDVDEIQADEDPEFQLQYQKNREAALAAVMEFLRGEGLKGAGRLLYEVEFLLLGPPEQEGAAAATKSGAKSVVGDEEQIVSCRAQLLAVVAETILDESMPAAAVPFLVDLFKQSARRLLPANPALKVDLVGRLMAALASRGQAASRDEEAVALLSNSLGSTQLLADGCLAEYNGCLSCVLDCCSRLPPSTVSRLLACFDLGGFSAAILHRGTPDTEHNMIQLGGQESGSALIGKPSPAAARILRFAVSAFVAAGGEAAGVDLLAGLLAAGGHAAYFNACLALVLAARTASARDAGLAFLTRQNFDVLPIDVVVEAIVQVTDGLNQAESARHEVPYILLQKLIQAPCSLAALRQVVATGKGKSKEGSNDGQDPAWTASVSDSSSQETGAPGGSSSSSGSNALKRDTPQVMLLAVQPRGDAVERIELLIGACLQSILRRFGSGLDGMSMTEELTQLLALLMEPVGANTWMVDWIWSLYKEALQPFLVLAGPASDGAAIHRFRECWACLPWHRATFHCISPGGLSELGAYLLAPDRGALDLLHALPWEPILQRLAPAAEPGAGPLPEDGQLWATQLALLALQSLVLLPADQLPGWLVGLIAPAVKKGPVAAEALRLPHVIAAADAHVLQEVLCNCVEGLPFLLQPLVDAPSLMQGDPGPRLLQVAGLLTAAASTSSSAAVAAMAASVVHGIMFTSVCRGFISGQGHSADADLPEARGTTEVIECWHLTAEEHSSLVSECLLPLCRLHAPGCMHAASIFVRHKAEPASSAGASEQSDDAAPRAPAPAAVAGWRAPQLAQLVNRLGPHAAASPLQPGPAEAPLPPKALLGSRLAVLGPPTEVSSSSQHDNANGQDYFSQQQYIAAAVPAHILLSCLMAHPRTVLTADPLPFANAETPLGKPLSELGLRDGDDGSVRDGEGSEAASTADSEATQDFLDRAISMAQKLKIQRRGKRAPTRQRLLRAEAASLQTIQSQIAASVEDSCQRQANNLPLSILRVGFTCGPLRRLPLGSALLEGLLQFLLLSRSAAPEPAPPLTASASGGNDTSRQRSYTEQMLDAAVEPPDPSAAEKASAQEGAAAGLLRTLEGLDDAAIVQVCNDASDARTPLVQALASEKARRLTVADERVSWRHNVSQVLRAAAAAEARPGAPCHIAAVWLASLLWLEDGRWRKLRSGGAPTDALEGLLDALSRRVLLLNLPPPAYDSQPATPSGTGSGASDFHPHPASTAHAPEGGKTLSRLTQNLKRMLPGTRGGEGGASSGEMEEGVQDSSAVQRRGLGRLKARFLKRHQQGTVDIPPSSFDYESSMGFSEMQGPRFGKLDPIPSGDSEAGSSRPQTPSRNSEYSSPPGSPEEPQHRRGFTGLFVRTTSPGLPSEVSGHRSKEEAPARPRPARDYAARLAGDVKKALTGAKKAEAAAAEAAAKEAEAEAAAEAATDVVIRLGLAAFAVSAYIKTVLCPSLSSYTPRMSSASLAADLASSGGALAAAVLGAQLQRQSASLGSMASISASGTPRISSHISTPSASLDKLQREDLLMHELDQVLETRAELDSLEEIARCPLVAARADDFRSFFAAAPQLLRPAAAGGVQQFQRELVQLLFPDSPFLCAWACAPPAAPNKGVGALHDPQ
ncbi:hypothetical protein COCOBI_01-6140 [Coccomyxa sp. Obi]|nr:hypothetical protein COCOBI_01-6140 [Coccomyxa sp. Obi]